ncbi:MAG: phosphodiester glycosidase family protein [Candidatus Marinimicrobia bacterium]|nr:phosphodiester glycosidase family protein [Candidatus Neomarinimicrobiota bacterium]
MYLKKFLFLVLSFSVFAVCLSGAPKGELIAPGVWYYHDHQESVPWDIHVVTVCLSTPSVTVETIKAGNQLRALEKTSSMVSRFDGNVVAAVNADFFQGDGMPVGAQVIQGELIKNPTIRSVFGITNTKEPFIQIVKLDAFLLTPENIRYEISYVNGARNKDNLVMFTPFVGTESPANRWGTEISTRCLDGYAVNDWFQVVVTEKSGLLGPLQKPTMIPEDGMVLSAHGKAKRFADRHIEKGDTLNLMLRLLPVNEPVYTLVGGIPRIIRDGEISIEHMEENLYEEFRTTRHPRTAVAFDKTKDTLYLMTVDGRQPRHSVGMSLDELAKYLKNLGAYQALNLDGGGSTTMVVKEKIVNKPSDATGERSVTNALLIVTRSSNPIQ